ncbi:MAG: DinB family protein [Dehalococcoidia bacterium]|nr:MAG: DinB family protein [Dehalococcoidia bacterium]
MLAQLPEAAISHRPPSGEWSVLENVRHLLFAEQAHMGRLFRERPTWSPLGFTPETMRAARKLPLAGTDDPSLAEVWAEWDRIHRQTIRRLKAMPATGTEDALTRHLRHLRAHIAVIERLGRQALM